ncbi:MAG: hypothetical protein LQ348_007788, partial [Seirophora lacunosa]
HPPAHLLSLPTTTMPALPYATGTYTNRRNRNSNNGQCDRTCTIALAVIFPVVFVALILGIVYLAWGKEYLDQRRRARAEKEAAERKLGVEEEESVASGDVSILDGEVLRMNERRAEEGRREESRVEEGHEHDHVLAMIAARP